MFLADLTLFPFFRFICAEKKFPPGHVSTTTTLKVQVEHFKEPHVLYVL